MPTSPLTVFDSYSISEFGREQGTGNREQGAGNREQGTGNREQGTGNRGTRRRVWGEGVVWGERGEHKSVGRGRRGKN
ncbi:hypothetical protein LYNGBM3L_33710 [Moorena producens 3L]|uniref:Uncharacterized protein n=1 Tax=Moorena producens 3L TaxID=489825 RepID=F4XUI6_9CYAN|nr:hypothetical protein [Moorena producens]EGJ31811.1 hypothetical protein LYNGBM3L_33710 [Moorena producens 3L]OLT63826.1 hypothetical protein BI334_01210 [Moorena producens 3L]